MSPSVRRALPQRSFPAPEAAVPAGGLGNSRAPPPRKPPGPGRRGAARQRGAAAYCVLRPGGVEPMSLSKEGERVFRPERLAWVLCCPHRFLTHRSSSRGRGRGATPGGSGLLGLEICCGRAHPSTPSRVGESWMVGPEPVAGCLVRQRRGGGGGGRVERGGGGFGRPLPGVWRIYRSSRSFYTSCYRLSISYSFPYPLHLPRNCFPRLKEHLLTRCKINVLKTEIRM